MQVSSCDTPQPVHVQHSLDKVYAYGSCNGSVIETILNVAHVIWQPPPDIPVHAPTGSQHAIALPSCHVVPCVWIGGRIRSTVGAVEVCHGVGSLP